MRNALLGLVALSAGVLAGDWLVRFLFVHQVAGQVFQRGNLIALVGQRGIFQADLTAREGEEKFRAGTTEGNVDQGQRIALRNELIAREALRMNADKVDASELAHESATLRNQFADDRQFRTALRSSGVSQSSLQRTLAETMRGEQWIENQIASQISVSNTEVQKYFEEHQTEFVQPMRIRARHIFLAAPEGSAPELMEAKQRAILDIAARLGRGEDFGELAAAVSEDEASKGHGGDLGFFAANRVPAEFFEAAEKLPPNAPPRFLQSHLGFHALQVTDLHPARPLTLAEATPEITARIAAEKRRPAVAALESELAQRARFVLE
jgi:parvulin-like peptidyl-prolyl isomerase